MWCMTSLSGLVIILTSMSVWLLYSYIMSYVWWSGKRGYKF
uniref:ATP synthase F0 subunit 8 n=1 Tax=Raeta pulchella TaxID=2109557 RepID=A0AA49X6E5_9BIVA|nr:ATP synthase F0 subunit 8 [Raeta pulchella]WLK25945.1 ATP synthase F0 subunit 8 [Raeta pulchella]